MQAGQEGVHEREKISPVPLLFIAGSRAVSLLPVPQLPAVTDVFSLGQRHVQRPTCLDKLGGLSVRLTALLTLGFGWGTDTLAWAVEGVLSLSGR